MSTLFRIEKTSPDLHGRGWKTNKNNNKNVLCYIVFMETLHSKYNKVLTDLVSGDNKVPIKKPGRTSLPALGKLCTRKLNE